ncbi:transcription factor PAP1-domain-containing protein [Tricharina praecox]|uniref:transcription factor PAP1-domain-containing protein n=1 Tax=Tricharina praecox TaxID=43433 RepID=UPI002220A41E|nr:transcription factor PAP1-domain-containing protein [Tricharina praecox]KAI5849737.1 transcription factor PAP1-domain-containing protein [Tricharina praecox]
MTATAPDNLYLSPDQQDLLLAALTSNSSSSPMFTPGLSHHIAGAPPQQQQQQQQRDNNSNPRSYAHGSPPALPTTEFPHGTPLLDGNMDYGDWDAEFDQDGTWDYDLGTDLMHDTPPSTSNDGNETTNGDTPHPSSYNGDKRKDPPQSDGTDDPHESEPKRRDDKDNKTAKKPGRKPLTSEPTSKRKAQNRAAQRAFRERKEKHLKDLEQKVEDLQKASESANHENSMLRAQVDRLQTELREYKRRLHTTELTRSSSLANMGGFQFDFPPFGSGIFGSQKDSSKDGLKLGTGFIERISSLDPTQQQKRPSATPTTGNHGNGSSKSLPSPPSTVNSSLSDLFSPSIIESINKSSSPDYMTGVENSSLQNTPKLNGGRDPTSSPSASSVSQHGPGSSCGTTPEPCNGSPTSFKPTDPLGPISEEGMTTHTSPGGDTYVCKSGVLDGETETTFCEKLGMACGNPHNPIPKVPQFSTTSDATTSSLDWLSQQSSGNNFDPVLFNDYRDPVNDINTTIGMSFFDDAFPAVSFDTTAPAPTANPTTAESKKDLIAAIDALNDEDDDEVVPADDPKQMLSCNKIWDRISSHPRFVSGELDMDGLCSELRSKAKCSEVGVVVAENDVQEVLGKVGMSHKDIM